MVINIFAFGDDFIVNHNRWSNREIKGEILISDILSLGPGSYLDANVVLTVQPGQHLVEMLSRSAIWFIHKKMDFYHIIPLVSSLLGENQSPYPAVNTENPIRTAARAIQQASSILKPATGTRRLKKPPICAAGITATTIGRANNQTI